METISIGDAKSRFSELVSRAMAGERFVVQRRNRPVAALIGSAELDRLERLSEIARRLAEILGQDAELLKQVEAERIHPAMAAYGLWRDEQDLASLAEEIAENRGRQGARGQVKP
ncbi:MAG: type II toxin-antitoxin system Phd/YefM family antitoxin [Anaerolineae bacterium]